MPKDFKGQDLRNWNFEKEDLRGADFCRADIRKVKFTDAKLAGAKFTDTKLAGAEFIGARTGVHRLWMVLPFCICISFVLCSLLDFVGILFAVVFTTFLLPPNFPQDTGVFPYIEMSVIQLGIYVIFARQGFRAKGLTITTFVACVLTVAGPLAIALTGSVAVGVGVVGAAAVAGTVAVAFAGALALALAPALALGGAVTSTGVFVLAFALADVLAFGFAPAFAPADAVARAIAGAGDSAGALANARATASAIALAALLLSLYVAWRSSKEDEKFEPAHSLGLWLGVLGGTSFKAADLSEADFSGATLSNCDFSGATVTRTVFKYANQLKWARLKDTILKDKAVRDLLVTGQGQQQNYHSKNLRGANLVRADLGGAVFTEADITDADLHGANLTNANLTRSRFVGSNLGDAVVENAIVTDIDIQRLQGLPKPPDKLRLDSGDEMVVLQGEEAKSFFLRPEEVKVVLDRALPDRVLAAYHLFIAESKAKNEWPRDVAFIGAYVNHGQTILSYQAPNVEDVVVNLPLLLQPFPSIDAVDWSKTLETYSKEQVEPLVGALVVKKEFRSLIADKLRKYDEFTSTKPVAVRINRQTIPLEWVAGMVGKIPPGVNVTFGVTLVEGDQHMIEQHFHSGHFERCKFGVDKSVTNYFGVMDNLGTVEEDVKHKLKEARNAIEKSDLSDAKKGVAVDVLNKLTVELGKPQKDPGRIERYWNRIKEFAPTVASILDSVEKLAKLPGDG